MPGAQGLPLGQFNLGAGALDPDALKRLCRFVKQGRTLGIAPLCQNSEGRSRNGGERSSNCGGGRALQISIQQKRAGNSPQRDAAIPRPAPPPLFEAPVAIHDQIGGGLTAQQLLSNPIHASGRAPVINQERQLPVNVQMAVGWQPARRPASPSPGA